MFTTLRHLLAGLSGSLLVLGFVATPIAAAASPLAAGPTTVLAADASGPATRAHLLVLVNQQRASNNLSPLTDNPHLDTAAQDYAQVLVADTCFGHTCGAQPDFTGRDESAGYAAWTMLGENVAAGQLTPEAVVAAWMGSPEHRANILRPEFTDIGLGIAVGGAHGMYWAQEFGTQS